MEAAEPHKVVVVDDELPIVAVVCEILADENIQAISCEHGNKAFGCINREAPDLVVLDVQMPGMDGIQVFHQMRANPTTANIPVIFFTANSSVVNQRLPNYRDLNAALLAKPVRLAKFLELVRGFLG